MRIREIMTANVVTCTKDTTVREAAALLREYHIGGLPVMDRNAVIGIVTESDILGLLSTGRISEDLWLPSPLELIEVPVRELVNWERTKKALANIGDTKVAEVMSHPVISVTGETDIEEAAALMVRHRIARLPVIEDGRLVGIVARADIIRAVGGRHEGKREGAP